MPRKVKGVLLVLVLLLIPALAIAGTVGKITGRVVDASDGSPFPDVSVVLYKDGNRTFMGASTTPDGRFMINNVPVGTYSIQISVLESVRRVEGVRVSADEIVTLPDITFSLDIVMDVVDVRGDRPYSEDIDHSIGTIQTGDQLDKKPISTLVDHIKNMQGAVETSGGLSSGIHVRGGRTGELAYVVDGINANDPVTGESGVYIDNSAIQEVSVITGNFNAEYGNAMSGVVNIVTREGSERYRGMVEYETDAHLRLSDNPIKYPNLDMWYNKVSLSVGGPLIPGIGNAPTFFVSGNWLDNENRLRHNDQHRWSGTAKIAWRPFGKVGPKFTLSGNYSNQWYHAYIHGYSKGHWLSYGGPRVETDNYQLNLRVSQTFGAQQQFTYNVNVGTFNTHTGVAYMDGAHFHDFRMTGRSQMSWVGWAYNEGEWVVDTLGDSTFVRLYNADYMDFNIPDSIYAYTDDDEGTVYFNIVDHYLDLVTDQEGNVDTASAVWFFYNEYVSPKGYYIEGNNTFSWFNWEGQLEALNDRWYEVNEWRPTVDSNTQDTIGVHYHKFDFERYKEMYLSWKDWRPHIDSVTGDSVTENPWEDSLESSGNMYLVRYNSDPLFRRFSYYFLPLWSDRNTTKYIADMSLDWSPNDFHWLKFGLNANYHLLDYESIQFVNENPYSDFYHKEPIIASAYVQDRIKYEDLTLNAGLRFDYFDPVANYYIDPDSVDLGTERARPKFQISPRVSVSFAVTDESMMFASYGHFFQPVELRELYQNLEADLTTGVPLLGNPNLPPLKTIFYQAGYRRALGDNMVFELKGYYKDQENLLATRQINTIYKGKLATYTVFAIEDFAKIKGFDVGFATDASRVLSGMVTYSFMDAKGTGSSGREFYYRYRGSSNEPPRREYPLEFDITHTVRANANLNLPMDTTSGLRKWLSDFNLNVQFNYSSGAPYWGTDSKGNIIPLGTRRMPGTKTVDLKFEKRFRIGRAMILGAYVDVRNVFDWTNVASVYSNTGLPDDNGGTPVFEPALYRQFAENGFTSEYEYWQADVADWADRYAENPGNFGAPRLLRFGLRVNFF